MSEKQGLARVSQARREECMYMDCINMHARMMGKMQGNEEYLEKLNKKRGAELCNFMLDFV